MIYCPGGATGFSPALGFNPGNRPPGRRALQGRQVRFIRNRREAPIYSGPAIAQICADAHYFSEREIVSLPNKPLYLFGSIRSAFGPRDLSPTFSKSPSCGATRDGLSIISKVSRFAH